MSASFLSSPQVWRNSYCSMSGRWCVVDERSRWTGCTGMEGCGIAAIQVNIALLQDDPLHHTVWKWVIELIERIPMSSCFHKAPPRSSFIFLAWASFTFLSRNLSQKIPCINKRSPCNSQVCAFASGLRGWMIYSRGKSKAGWIQQPCEKSKFLYAVELPTKHYLRGQRWERDRAVLTGLRGNQDRRAGMWAQGTGDGCAE